jgi:hypothetical protein
VYFRDPATRKWHALVWEHAGGLNMPLSDEALRFARRLAADKYRFPDDRLALDELLARWQQGVGSTRAERRLMLRLTRQHKPLTDELAQLHARDADTPAPAPDAEQSPPQPEMGDDDIADEPDDYYHDAVEEA